MMITFQRLSKIQPFIKHYTQGITLTLCDNEMVIKNKYNKQEHLSLKLLYAYTQTQYAYTSL